MYQNFEYRNPLDIVSLFKKQEDLVDFFSYLIKRIQELSINANNPDTFISPIVYVRKAYVINIDYNYLIQSIATWSGIDRICMDFLLKDFENETNSPYSMFLIKGLFEYVYGLIWLRDSIDTSKYSGKTVKPKPRFYNILVLKKKNNATLFFAVPFSSSALKSFLPREIYVELLWLSKGRYQQLAFGKTQYSQLDLNIRNVLKKF